MLKTVTVLAATAALSIAAAAHDAAPHRFTRDGETFVYTSTAHDARQVIDGYSRTSGSRFHLIVRNGLVSGTMNGQQVSFRVADASSAVELAAR